MDTLTDANRRKPGRPKKVLPSGPPETSYAWRELAQRIANNEIQDLIEKVEQVEKVEAPVMNYESTLGRVCSRVVFHTGIQVGKTVHNSLDTVRHNVQMKLCEHGVLITEASGEQMIVGMADILSIKLA